MAPDLQTEKKATGGRMAAAAGPVLPSFLPKNRHMIGEFQAEVDRYWQRLLELWGETERSDRLVRSGGAGSQ